jgi:enoyl-[acyl-carrier-protein] reductase (NADH)
MILQDKVALVTGGTAGIGQAAAIAFGAAGAKVVFSGRRDAECETTSAMIRETGAECLFVRSDVSSEAEVQALVEKAIATYGRLDFNNGREELIFVNYRHIYFSYIQVDAFTKIAASGKHLVRLIGCALVAMRYSEILGRRKSLFYVFHLPL